MSGHKDRTEKYRTWWGTVYESRTENGMGTEKAWEENWNWATDDIRGNWGSLVLQKPQEEKFLKWRKWSSMPNVAQVNKGNNKR